MRRINVLIYEPYPMGKGGGNLRTLAYILKFLDRSRFNPIILSPEETEVLSRFRDDDGVEVIVVTPPPSIHRFAGQVLKDRAWGRLRSGIDLFRYNARLGRMMRARKIDVLYCNSIRALLLAGIGARLAGVPTLWYVKGALENPLLDRAGLFLANRTIFFCETNRDDRYPRIISFLGKRIGTVRIGLDRAVIERAEAQDKTELVRSLDIRGDRINGLILAQLYPPKGQHFVLDGMRRIIDAHPDFHLYIAGNSVLAEYEFYRNDLEKIIERDKLHDHVTFTGWRSDALQLISVMDMIIHPSLAEGFGRAVLEAMALGKPVVASAVGGLREIIRDGENGFLVPPGDTNALVDRISRLCASPALRESFGREARREVMAHYLIEDKIQELEKIWAEMAENG